MRRWCVSTQSASDATRKELEAEAGEKLMGRQAGLYRTGDEP
ncbi:MAG: hypothetical protein ACLUD2_17545 [Clostridium sp.]